MTLLPRHYCIHQVLSHLLLQLNHWSLGNAKAAWDATVKWENTLYSPFYVTVEMLLRYIKWNRVFGKSFFSLYLYFTPLVSNMNSRDDLTGRQVRVIDPRPDQNFYYLPGLSFLLRSKLEIPAFFFL